MGSGHAVAAAELRAFIERVERLEAERKDLAASIKDVMAEAKGRGYDTKAIRALIRERAADPEALAEARAVLDLYRDALDGFDTTPLGRLLAEGKATVTVREGHSAGSAEV